MRKDRVNLVSAFSEIWNLAFLDEAFLSFSSSWKLCLIIIIIKVRSRPCVRLNNNNNNNQLSELAGRMNAQHGPGTVIYEERDARDATLAQR